MLSNFFLVAQGTLTKYVGEASAMRSLGNLEPSRFLISIIQFLFLNDSIFCYVSSPGVLLVKCHFRKYYTLRRFFIRMMTIFLLSVRIHL